MYKGLIITIGRQYGSGGRKIGKLLAQKLNVPFYDRALIEAVSKSSGLDEKVIEKVDERANSFLSSLFMVGGNDSMFDLSLNDKVYLAQSEKIKKFANEGSCVIVGRCADYILNETHNILKIFIFQDMEGKKERAVKYYDIPEDKAESVIAKIDKQRAAYYNYYTNIKWGNINNYDLCINSRIGIEKSVKVILDFIETYHKTDV